MIKAYTGVGSRNTPEDVQKVMIALGNKLAEKGYVLRSGAAEGADYAFEMGWWEHYTNSTEEPTGAEIYIAWNGFNGHSEGSCDGHCYSPKGALLKQAEQIASEIHPAWDRCSRGAKALHSRNVFQVLGLDLKSPSKFLICWAETKADGTPKGGTATAWNLACKYNIPCFNLFIADHKERVMKFLEGNNDPS